MEQRPGGALPAPIAAPRISPSAWPSACCRVVALALLSLVALWPEIGNDERGRFAAGMRGIEPQSGQLTDVHYSGVDERDRPYTVTASAAQQSRPERINLAEPEGRHQPGERRLADGPVPAGRLHASTTTSSTCPATWCCIATTG